VLSLATANLHNACPTPLFNKAVALGYLQVNSGAYEQAVQTFTAVLRDDGGCAAALAGRGSVHAFRGDLGRAHADFSGAVEGAPGVADYWKRRGQTASAMGRLEDGAGDLGVAVRCMEEGGKVDPDVYNQLGNIL
jgi:tetratricopeptide (TPR) repeat protein